MQKISDLGSKVQVNKLRNEQVDQALLLSLSEARLKKYLEEASGNLAAAISAYEYNTKISESFYTPLQCCEISLRNSLHAQLSHKYGERWFEDSVVPLEYDSKSQIESTLRDLTNATSPSPSAGSVVAELKFSFWVGLLSKKYDHSLWRSCLHKSFKGKSGKPRNDVHHRFNAIRRFRNRVFHHEPIFRNNPLDRHLEIIEAISWTCPHTAAWADSNSRVVEVINLAT